MLRAGNFPKKERHLGNSRRPETKEIIVRKGQTDNRM